MLSEPWPIRRKGVFRALGHNDACCGLLEWFGRLRLRLGSRRGERRLSAGQTLEIIQRAVVHDVAHRQLREVGLTRVIGPGVYFPAVIESAGEVDTSFTLFTVQHSCHATVGSVYLQYIWFAG